MPSYANQRALPEITPSIVNNFKNAIIYVYGLLYSSELSKSVHKIQIIIILLILFIVLNFLLHWIKSISSVNTSNNGTSSGVARSKRDLEIGEEAEPSLFSPQIISSPYFAPARWRLWWQFIGEIIDFLIQYITLLFIGAIRDVLVDTSLTGPWIEFILLRPLLLISGLVFVKILIQYLHGPKPPSSSSSSTNASNN